MHQDSSSVVQKFKDWENRATGIKLAFDDAKCASNRTCLSRILVLLMLVLIVSFRTRNRRR